MSIKVDEEVDVEGPSLRDPAGILKDEFPRVSDLMMLQYNQIDGGIFAGRKPECAWKSEADDESLFSSEIRSMERRSLLDKGSTLADLIWSKEGKYSG